MKYFETLPVILTQDPNGNQIIASNIMTRVSFLQNLADDSDLFYFYDIQDGDTPEILADKYYKDPYRYWIIMLANQMFDANWDWPISQKLFGKYINKKYSVLAAAANTTPLVYTQTNIKEYRKIITITNGETNDSVVKNYVIDSNTYTNLIVSTKSARTPSGFISTISTDKKAVNIYDYEIEQNEAKRSIRIVNNSYVSALENQLESLLNK